jgi:hypothetical protein
VTDQIEWVEVFADLLREFVEENALLFEFGHDGLLLLRRGPALEERVQRRILAQHRLAGVVFQRLGDELAFPEHVLVDYSTFDKKAVESKAKLPKAKAVTPRSHLAIGERLQVVFPQSEIE